MSGFAKKKRILLLVETSRTFGREIIQGVSRFACERGDWAIFLQDRGLQPNESFLRGSFRCHGIITRTVNEQMARMVDALRLPTIELLGDGKERTSDILTDPRKVGRTAAEHFLGKGFRNLAYFSLGNAWWADQFRDAFLGAAKNENTFVFENPPEFSPDDATLSISLTNTLEKVVVRWLRKLPKPIGVFCPSDSQALCILNLCLVAGIPVPYEVAVLGIENNATLCETASPPLSSIAVRGNEVGYKAARLLDLKIRRKKLPPTPILVAPSYVVGRQSSDLVAVDDPDTARLIRYIRDNAFTDLTVADLAGQANVSPRTLIRRFHEYLGHSPEAEIIRTRMERAKKLLTETTMNITTIAANVGYYNSESFTRAFRRECGFSPKSYRESTKKADV